MSTEAPYTVADLCTAAADGDLDAIKAILAAAPELINVHRAENDEHCALHYAVLANQPEAVRALMAAGADHRSGIYPHRDATTAAVIASERGLDQIVRIICDEDERRQLEACKNITISEDNDALFAAVQDGRDDQALAIIQRSPELLDACHRNGGSVAHAAASRGRHRLLLELLQRGADITHLTPEGQSPLDGAALNIRRRNAPPNEGCLLSAGILLQAGCPHSPEAAVALGDLEFVRSHAHQHPQRFQSNNRDRDGLLQLAIASDHLEMVRLLLDLGLDPNDRHQLLQYESRPYSWGEPLAWAAGNGQYACAELLLERGADPNASIYASGNPVSAAYNNADERMKGLLFRHGGILDPSTAGLEGETSAAAVALHNDPSLAAELLWAAGCGGDPNIVGMCLRQLDWSPQDERWFNLLEQPLRLWRTNPHRKFRDFDRAVYPEIFRMILKRGVDPNLAGRFGYRLAHRLAACGVVWNEPIMSEAERVAFATILLEHGADLNVVDELLQSSPLGWAARWGRYDLARLYLEQGADPILAGEEWATPLAWAEKKSNTDIADLIKRYL
ncbi:MAG: ankyrin repeat domain-containing protein [Candidatus Latescibacteria bacterium]|nr:ankyrin repeat domain-containing protein [Candidatus Latescibacterota bacterium]